METMKGHIVAHEMMTGYDWGMSNFYIKVMEQLTSNI